MWGPGLAALVHQIWGLLKAQEPGEPQAKLDLQVAHFQTYVCRSCCTYIWCEHFKHLFNRITVFMLIWEVSNRSNNSLNMDYIQLSWKEKRGFGGLVIKISFTSFLPPVAAPSKTIRTHIKATFLFCNQFTFQSSKSRNHCLNDFLNLISICQAEICFFWSVLWKLPTYRSIWEGHENKVHTCSLELFDKDLICMRHYKLAIFKWMQNL